VILPLEGRLRNGNGGNDLLLAVLGLELSLYVLTKLDIFVEPLVVCRSSRR